MNRATSEIRVGEKRMGGQERREKRFQERRDWILGREENGWTGASVKEDIFHPRAHVPKFQSPCKQHAVEPIFLLVDLINPYKK
jgi:hypothetical protein